MTFYNHNPFLRYWEIKAFKPCSFRLHRFEGITGKHEFIKKEKRLSAVQSFPVISFRPARLD
jgi:hypothetical protein